MHFDSSSLPTLAFNGLLNGLFIGEYDVRKGKDFKLIMNVEKPGRVRRMICSALAPDGPAHSLKIDKGRKLNAEALERMRRLTWFQQRSDAETARHLHDLLLEHEEKIEQSEQAIAVLEEICKSLQKWQTINDSGITSSIANFLGKTVQDLAKEALFKAAEQITQHLLTEVVTGGATYGVSTGISLGIKLVTILKKKHIAKAKVKQEKITEDTLSEAKFLYTTTDALLLGHLAKDLDKTSEKNQILARYLRSVRDYINNTILHLANSNLNFETYTQVAGFLLKDLENTSELVNTPIMLLSMQQDLPSLKIRKGNIQTEIKKLHEIKSDLNSCLLQLGVTKLRKLPSNSVSNDRVAMGKAQLTELRNGKVTKLVPVKPSAQSEEKKPEKDELAREAEVLQQIIDLLTQKESILTAEHAIVETYISELAVTEVREDVRLPESQVFSPTEITLDLFRVNSLTSQSPTYNKSLEPMFREITLPKFDSVSTLGSEYSKKLAHSEEMAAKRIQRIKDLTSSCNFLEKQIDTALTYYGTKHGESLEDIQLLIEKSLRAIEENLNELTNLALILEEKIIKYQKLPKDSPLLIEYQNLIHQYQLITKIIKPVDPTPTPRNPQLDLGKQLQDLEKQSLTLFSCAKKNKHSKSVVLLEFERFQNQCLQFKMNVNLMYASEEKPSARGLRRFFRDNYHQILSVAQHHFKTYTDNSKLWFTGPEFDRIEKINGNFSALKFNQSDLHLSLPFSSSSKQSMSPSSLGISSSRSSSPDSLPSPISSSSAHLIPLTTPEKASKASMSFINSMSESSATQQKSVRKSITELQRERAVVL